MLSNLKVLKNVVLGYIYKWLIDCKVFVIPSLSPNPNINSKLIVSMTSYGRRVEKSVVYYSLVSILRQTVKPDRIILCLDGIKWNDENLPKKLVSLKKKGTHNAAAQSSCQLLSQLNALLDILADAAADRDDHVCADQIDQLLSGLLNAQDLGLDVLSSQSECGFHDLAGISLGLIEGSLLHNAGTHGGHLRTEAGADDGSHQMAAECRAGHLQVAVFHIELLLGQVDSGALLQEIDVLCSVDVQMGSISGQAGVQTSCAAGAQIAADVGCADQQDFGLVLVASVV